MICAFPYCKFGCFLASESMLSLSLKFRKHTKKGSGGHPAMGRPKGTQCALSATKVGEMSVRLRGFLQKDSAKSAGRSPSEPSGRPKTLTLFRRMWFSAPSDFATSGFTVCCSLVSMTEYYLVQSSTTDTWASDSERPPLILSKSLRMRMHSSAK